MSPHAVEPAKGRYGIEQELGEPGMAGRFEQGRPARPSLNRSELIA